MKIYELCKELEIKVHDMMNYLKANNFKYPSSNSSLSDSDEVLLREKLKQIKEMEVPIEEVEIETDTEIRENDKINMVGVYYDYKKGKYVPITLVVLPEQLDSLKAIKHEEFSTIYNAKSKIGELTSKANFFEPNPLERILFKRNKK